MNKKKWVKPVLVVLMKGKPEEGVLQACKVQSQPIGNSPDDYGCYTPEPCCEYCFERSGS